MFGLKHKKMAIHPPPKADAFEEGVFSPSTIKALP
jgi:hypothetical protein